MQKMKNFTTFPFQHKKLTLFLLITIGILAAIFWPRSPKPLDTQTVKQTTITETVSTTGKIMAEKAVDLSFLAAGKLVYLGVKKGDTVKKWQTIATIDQRTLQKNLETKLRDYSLQRNSFDQTKDDYQNRTPEQALNDKMKRILQDNQYDLEKAVLSVELQDLAKEQSVLISPIDGIVTRADVSSAGVNIAATTTFSIADPQTTIFSIDIDEADVSKIKEGQEVNVTLDAYPDKQLPLTISSIDFQSHTSDNGGNVYTTKAALPQNQGIIYRLGMSGDAEIIVAEKTNALVISLASLTDDGSIYVKKDGTYEKRKIKTGIQSDTEIEVTDGLQAGEIVSLEPDNAAKLLQSPKKQFFFF
jgi:RND family efflux transporter MFP subunit